MNINKLLEEVAKTLRPTKTHLELAQAMVRRINIAIKKSNIDATAVLGGSVAKGTHLKENHDVDIFVVFSQTYREKKLSRFLGKILPKRALKVHGSRDYFHIKKNDLLFEIVPVLSASSAEQALNVTDMSPLHVAWVRKYLEGNQLADDIRLAKQFCKAANVYGAESYVKGFSGHILDILVIYYGSFMNLLKAATKWKSQVIIDPEKQLSNPLRDLNRSKTQCPLIIVDPLQKRRNAAAALSYEKFYEFIEASKNFLSQPDKSAFTLTPLDETAIRKLQKNYKGTNCYIITAVPTSGKTDIVGSKIMKIYENILTLLEDHFDVVNSGWEFGNPSILYFMVSNEVLSSSIEIRGPPSKALDHVHAFKSKHKKTFERKGFMYATEKRPYTDPYKFFLDAVKMGYIKTRAKKITVKKL